MLLEIFIYGASGSVCTYAVQLAKFFRATVTGVCSGANLNLIKSLGADKVIDYTKEGYTTNLEMYDLIFIAVDKFPFSVSNKFLNKTGVYLNIATPVKNLHMLWTSLTTKKKIIVGENPAESSEDLIFLKRLVEAGVLKVVIDRSYRLENMVEAHQYVDKGHKKGNVVITVNGAK